MFQMKAGYALPYPMQAVSHDAAAALPQKKRLHRRRPLSKFEVAQRLLLCRGSSVTPRAMVLTIHGRMKTSEVVDIMRSLCDRGAGYLHAENRKIHFVKKKAQEIRDILLYYGISEEAYMAKYCKPNLPYS